ncbi:MAG: SpoIIE family protein phosphatase [Burkholderiales bacterium]|nr:SpoIIE family protein phosphatase [Phycisphaerae bacterium]
MSSAWLIPMSGPTLEPIALVPSTDGLTIGRHEKCELRLPADAEQVSRQHARFIHDDVDGWRLQDLGSRWGTFINGVRLGAKQEIPIKPGDMVGISPWAFTLSSTPRARGLQLRDDAGQTIVRAVNDKNSQPLAENLLQLLLESAARIHASTSESELAENVIGAALRGTGLTNAVMLKPLDGLRAFTIISSHVSKEAEDSPAQFSRSLINGAATGNVAEISAGSGGEFSQSLVQMNVSAAICVPLMLGDNPAAFLYLDSRGSVLQAMRPNGSAFCVALSKMASLALANLKRVEIEKRQSHIDAELSAAAAAQKWIMPRRESVCGPLKAIGESRAGQSVGGDFFDIIPLSDCRFAVALGDVSGKGVSASVLMTATQGFLHAALQQYGEPGQAVTALNRFIAPRRPASRFVTMWVGVIDCQKRTLSYVDAAHSYALLRQADGTIRELSEGGGLPIGIMDDGEYTAFEVPFNPGDHIVVASDGIIEQPSADSSPDSRVQFEVEGVKAALSEASGDLVKKLFDRVIAHAGTEHLADDATAVWVGW